MRLKSHIWCVPTYLDRDRCIRITRLADKMGYLINTHLRSIVVDDGYALPNYIELHPKLLWGSNRAYGYHNASISERTRTCTLSQLVQHYKKYYKGKK